MMMILWRVWWFFFPPLVFLLLQVPSKRDVGKLQRKGYKDVWVMSIDAVAI